MPKTEKTDGRKTFAEIIRKIYLDRATGVVEIRHQGGTENLFFRQGELFLDRDQEVALRVSPLLADIPADSRLAAHEGLRLEIEKLAQKLSSLQETEIEFLDNPSMGVELVGPLPTVCFALAISTYGLNEDELIHRLGGSQTKFMSSDETPALQQLPGLGQEMAEVLVHLGKPTSPAQLLRGAGNHNLGVLRGLTQLWAVGLARRDGDVGDGPEPLVTPKLLASFSDRIATDLAATPLDLDPEIHRNRLAKLLGRLGRLNYYELLGIGPEVKEEQILVAYNRLARWVHPSHTESLGLQGKEEAVRVLFERATEAYLILSDPKRRASYNTVAGIHVDLAVDAEQREEEKRSIARLNYKRASTCLAQMDYSQAVDLLKEAVRMDPQPEYYVRLGFAQSKNPNWRPHAVASFEKGLEMNPDDLAVRLTYGQLLVEVEETEKARSQFQKVLAADPDHLEAREALERLGRSQENTVTGNFSSLFGNKKTSA